MSKSIKSELAEVSAEVEALIRKTGAVSDTQFRDLLWMHNLLLISDAETGQDEIIAAFPKGIVKSATRVLSELERGGHEVKRRLSAIDARLDLEQPHDVHPPHMNETRQAVWDMTGGYCAYCNCQLEREGRGPKAFVIEHVVPRSKGGPDNLENYVPACESCNASKGTMHVLRFIQKVKDADKVIPFSGTGGEPTDISRRMTGERE